MNNSCIIGHTGFVGSNLKNSMIFVDFYNSKNILEIKNKKYDLCVIAAPSAVKWKANKEPIQDLKSITSLLEILHDSHFKKVVLISTIDVYGDQVNLGLNEKDIPKWEVHPYGRNRKILETFLSDRFDCSVIRLPGLFGPGLKKNIIFDLMNDNMIHSISLDTEFQWLNLETLPEIIEFKGNLWESMIINIKNNWNIKSLVWKDNEKRKYNQKEKKYIESSEYDTNLNRFINNLYSNIIRQIE